MRPPASAQSWSEQRRAIDIAVIDLGLPGTFQVLINDGGLVLGTDGSTGANSVLDTRTGAFDGSVPPSIPSTSTIAVRLLEANITPVRMALFSLPN